jgi:hypothetical protein
MCTHKRKNDEQNPQGITMIKVQLEGHKKNKHKRKVGTIHLPCPKFLKDG